jgi:ribonucleotide reductase alpha subunit
VNEGGIMNLWTREARLFKYGSGTGSNFLQTPRRKRAAQRRREVVGPDELPEDRRPRRRRDQVGRHHAPRRQDGLPRSRSPDVEQFINWKVREELKVACLAEGIKHIAKDQQELAKKLGLKLDYDFNGEAYYTVSGQNSNNSVRIPNEFFKAVEDDGDWNLNFRQRKGVAKTIKARDLWEQIAYAAWRCADPGVQYDDTINQWHTCPQSGRINASNPCVTGDTRVLTPGGIWRRIDQMIHLPSRVITNLRDQEIHITEGAFPTGTKEVFELVTTGGYSVKVTADHKIWTRSRGWVAAQHLTTNDEIRLPHKTSAVQEIGEPQDPKFFQMLGLFLSDANHDANALHLDACLPSHDIAEQFSRYVTENWQDRTYADDYVNQLMVANSDGIDSDDTDTITVTLTNRRLLSRLKGFVRTDAGKLPARLERRGVHVRSRRAENISSAASSPRTATSSTTR